MSGHSKWANMKHRKGAADAMKNQLITKICREIIVAAKLGGGLLENNARLRAAVALAKKNSVPAKNIDNAIKKGTGELGGAIMEEITYEGYGPAGVAVFIEASSDNRNRTVSEVRACFTKCGGQFGQDGSVAWIFDRKGQIVVAASHYKVEDDLMELAIEAGAEDLKREGDNYHIYTHFEDLYSVKDNLEKLSVHVESTTFVRLAKTQTKIETEDDAIKMIKLLDKLDDCEDVMNVFTNYDIEDSLMEKISDKI